VFSVQLKDAFNRLLEGYKLNNLNKIIPAIFDLKKDMLKMPFFWQMQPLPVKKNFSL
jgi:hypothetical protein